MKKEKLIFWSFYTDPEMQVYYGLKKTAREFTIARFIETEEGYQISEHMNILSDDKEFLELLNLFFETRIRKIRKELET